MTDVSSIESLVVAIKDNKALKDTLVRAMVFAESTVSLSLPTWRQYTLNWMKRHMDDPELPDRYYMLIQANYKNRLSEPGNSALKYLSLAKAFDKWNAILSMSKDDNRIDGIILYLPNGDIIHSRVNQKITMGLPSSIVSLV